MVQTIVEKLNLNRYTNKTILNAPADHHYFDDLEITQLTNQLTDRKEDLVIVFVYSKAELIQQITSLTSFLSMNKDGYLFVAYPKIGNPTYPNTVHRDEIFPALAIDPQGDGYLGKTDFKFSRMVKLDETFTIIGLKFTPIRKKMATSQKVADYTSFVSHLQQQLQAEPTLLTLFETLAPGYQRNWARYVFSAKQQATQTKRFEEMKKILALGYKSKELYLQAQRG